MILKKIKNLDPNKSDGHDILSIRIFKLCGESIYKPLNLIFKFCLETDQFPSDWKKANVVPVFKKGDKQLLKDFVQFLYSPSLVKFLKDYFIMISQNQSGFKPGDSCINQLAILLSLTRSTIF